MSLTIDEAATEMQTLFKAAWDADPVSTGITLYYDDLTKEPPLDAPWALVSVEHLTGHQASLTGGLGTTMWNRRGIVRIGIRTVLGKGLKQNRQLGMVAVNAFEGKTTPGSVWFRNVRYTPAPGRDGKWQQGTVIAEFTYDQIK